MKGIYIFIVSLFTAVFVTGDIYADITYNVKKGDNPYVIARKFKVSSRDILKANDIKPHNLRPGVKITIPSDKKDALCKNKPFKKQAGKRDEIKTVMYQDDSSLYTVKKGDTLFSIAKKYSMTVDEIKQINEPGSRKLKIGRKLFVKRPDPRDYTVKKGDTLWNIAQRFHVDPDELKDINGLETDSLQLGQKILLKPDEAEVNETRNFETILSQGHEEKETETITESKEISNLGMKDRLILFAKKMLDIPYRFGGNTLLGIDCSAYVKRVYSLIGIDLPRSAREQFMEGKPVDENELSIGDLVFFRTYASFPSHVGIYLGNNLFIHASSRSKKVTIDSLETPYYLKRFIGAKRLIEVKEEKEKAGKEG